MLREPRLRDGVPGAALLLLYVVGVGESLRRVHPHARRHVAVRQPVRVLRHRARLLLRHAGLFGRVYLVRVVDSVVVAGCRLWCVQACLNSNLARCRKTLTGCLTATCRRAWGRTRRRHSPTPTTYNTNRAAPGTPSRSRGSRNILRTSHSTAGRGTGAAGQTVSGAARQGTGAVIPTLFFFF